MIKLKSLIIILLLSVSFKSFSQEEKKYSCDVYGILDMQGFYTSRNTYNAIDGLFSLYPLAPSYDAQGKDLNGKSSLNFSSSPSRIGVRLKLGEAMGAKISGVIEGDLTGQADGIANFFRLRVAHINMNWNKAQLLVGQYWNPMVLPEMMPSNRDLHNGAPFHPFTRENQVRLDYHPYENFNLVAAIGLQRDYATIGVNSVRDYKQQNNTMLPEVNLHFQYKTKTILAGIGGRFLAIQPRENIVQAGETYSLDEKIYTFASTAYFNYKKGKDNLKMQALLGDNMNDLNLLGGYYESAFDTVNNSYSYKPTTVFSSWIDYAHSFGKFKPAIIIGYSKNFDVNESSYANAYGLGMTIDNYIRVAPRIEYFFKDNFSLTLALEYSSVKYKDEVYKDRVNGFRTALAFCYLFNY
jgi:hypothetical protein